MAVLIPYAITIAQAVATAVSVIATIVVTIATFIGKILIVMGTLILKSVAFVLVKSAIMVTGLIKAGMLGIVKSITLVANLVITTAKGLYIYAQTIYTGIKKFLEVIHFKTILKIHRIAFIFSVDYNRMIRKLYNEISEVSEALGLGAQFLTLALQDARNLTMDVSSMMGRSYDLAEITWLNNLNGYLTTFHTKTDFYQDNPGDVLKDIGFLLEEPQHNAKKEFQRGIITLLDGVVTVADRTVEKTVKLREDLDQAILHLPKEISKKIYDNLNPQLERFDRFINEEYQPVSENITNAIDVLTDTTVKQTDKLHSLANLILNPGDMLGNIDNLSELERIRQEGKIAEIANRAPNRSVKTINQNIDTTHQGLKEIYEALIEERVKPPYHVPEVAGLQYPPGVLPALHKSWFVGDF